MHWVVTTEGTSLSQSALLNDGWHRVQVLHALKVTVLEVYIADDVEPGVDAGRGVHALQVLDHRGLAERADGDGGSLGGLLAVELDGAYLHDIRWDHDLDVGVGAAKQAVTLKLGTLGRFIQNVS